MGWAGGWSGGGGGGGTVSSGVVQLSGGLAYPGSLAGEAALYDQNGQQILGRTAIRHWLDPHPDAASFDETWEFSTTGDMTQGQLEAAGWAFENCTAEVSGGVLWLTATTNLAPPRAYLVVNLTGDYDICVTGVNNYRYNPGPYESAGADCNCGIGIGRYESGVTDLMHYIKFGMVNGGTLSDNFYANGAWTSPYGGVSDADQLYTRGDIIARAVRYSGILAIVSGGVANVMCPQFVLNANSQTYLHGMGWTRKTWIADTTTFNRLALIPSEDISVGVGTIWGVASVRRFM